MSEVYERDSIFLAYVKWHYNQGFREFFKITQNFLWFVVHFFSFQLLLKTLFAPWKRLGEHYGGGLDLEAFASTLIVNGLMRGVGFSVKILVLIIGSVSYLAVLSFAFAIFVVWVLMPIILLGSLILSVTFFVI